MHRVMVVLFAATFVHACGPQSEASNPEPTTATAETEPIAPPPTASDTPPPAASSAVASSSATAPTSASASSGPKAISGTFETPEALLKAMVEAANAKDREKLMTLFATPGEGAEAGACPDNISYATSCLRTPYSQQYREYGVNQLILAKWKAQAKLDGIEEGKKLWPKDKCQPSPGVIIQQVRAKLDVKQPDKFVLLRTEKAGWKLLAAQW